MTTLKRRSPLGIAKKEGSAHQGAHHWIMQRMTSVALVGLGLWFLYSGVTHDLSHYEVVVLWLQHPVSCALMMLTLGVGLYHSFLGLQVVLEDYVHNEGVKFITLVGLKVLFGFLILASFASLMSLQGLIVVPDGDQVSLLSVVETLV